MTETDNTGRVATLTSEIASAHFHDIQADLMVVQSAVLGILDDCARHDRRPEASDLNPLESVCRAVLLDSSPLVQGVGFNAAEDLLADYQYRVFFWYRDSAGGIAELFPTTTPGSQQAYEYHELDWFSAAREAAGLVGGGPFVDYGGSNQYTLTLALPVSIGTTFKGVVSSDVSFASLESTLSPTITQAAGPLALVNEDDRIVVSNRAHLTAGAILARTNGWECVPCRWLPWRACWQPSD
jgi:hypothetical protein